GLKFQLKRFVGIIRQIVTDRRNRRVVIPTVAIDGLAICSLGNREPANPRPEVNRVAHLVANLCNKLAVLFPDGDRKPRPILAVSLAVKTRLSIAFVNGQALAYFFRVCKRSGPEFVSMRHAAIPSCSCRRSVSSKSFSAR